MHVHEIVEYRGHEQKKDRNMNIQEQDILFDIYQNTYTNQRVIVNHTGHSLGLVNKSLKNLIKDGYLHDNMQLTFNAKEIFKNNVPKNAIILAAGFGMRMVPINTQTPKALIEIDGETLIERIIKQLHEVGIKNIYIVVGFMKEQFEYLIDEYDVELIVNEKYTSKNNLHSLYLASDYLANSYIIPCDIWADRNPFSKHELYSWYMVTNLVDDESDVRVNRKRELVMVSNGKGGNSMIGISYLTKKEADIVRQRLQEFDKNKRYDNVFWETTLYDGDRMIVPAKVVHASDYVEINTYEQLRELDDGSNHLKSDAINVIVETFKVNSKDIVNIEVLKKGMTNRSFLFTCKGKRYIMRIPGEGTEQLINRQEEAEVYQMIAGRKICDNVIYINPDNGYKITEFIEDSRVCDVENVNDLELCMEKLQDFHKMKLKVKHTFDIFRQIEFYESLWCEQSSIYRDYTKTKENVFSLKKYIDAHKEEYCLTHIDAVPDNFLFTNDGDVRLIDWEYAAMQDPHVDIAMFCIYAMYDRTQVERLIDIYFNGNCKSEVRIKIYCYIAACGLLWSNWCEYKRSLGVEFGEYSLRQYRYAKEYYRIVRGELEDA